jgi:hypothetical protein
MPWRAGRFFSLVHATIARIAKGVLFITMQQCAGLSHIVDVGRRAGHRVHLARLGIVTDMRLHPKVRLLALPTPG